MKGIADIRRSIVRATLLATVGSLLAYGASLIQWVVYARILGATSATDSLAAALAWLVGLTGLVGSVFTSLITPAYLQAADAASNRQALFRTAHAGALALGAGMGVVTFLVAESLSTFLLPGSDSTTHRLLTDLLRLLSPLGVLWVLVYTTSSLANAHERYTIAAASGILPSVPVLAALLFGPAPTVQIVGLAFELGLMIQVAILVAAVWPWRWELLPKPTRSAALTLAVGGSLLAVAFLLINAGNLILRSLASFSGAGDVTILDYGLRLTSALETLLLSGVLAVSFTVWSLDAIGGTERLAVTPALRGMLGYVVPGAIALAALSGPLVTVLFAGGRLGGDDVALLARFVAFVAVGVAAHSVYVIVLRLILARRLLSVLVFSAAIELAVLALLGWLLVGPMGLDGLAIAFGISWLAALIYCISSIPSVRADAPALGAEFLRALVVGGASAAAALWTVQGQGSSIAQLVVGGVAFSIIWALLGWVVGLGAAQLLIRAVLAPLGARTWRGS